MVDYIFAVIIVYENTAEVTRQITQQYHDFHKKVDCEMEGKLVWTEKGREAPVDRQASVAMLLDMLRENVAGVLKGFRLEESDEDALISLMKRHGAKVKEITQLRAAMGIKSNAVELPAETTTTAKLAGGVLHRRFFEAPPKQPNGAVEDTQSNKRQRHEPDLLEGVDVFADRLSTKFWATVSAYISHGPNIEERTIRWQHMLKNMHIIGQTQKREQKTANGSIDPAALKHLQSATEASPLQKRSKGTSKATRTDTQVAADVNDSSDNVAETEGPTTPSVRQRNRVQIPATPPQTPSPRRKTGSGMGRMALEHQNNWRTAWDSYIESHATTKWASGITNVLAYMFSHQSVDDIVRLTADIYQAKESITLHNSTITHTQVLSIKDGAKGVALGYKALWSALEVATMSKSRELFAYSTLGKTLCALEEQLDDIGSKAEIQLGEFAHLYLEDRRSKPRSREDQMQE
ncbi:hypothetical protein D6D20_02810 [Aureobasidium pullulans]|uniref:Uncharacterized protein n=1 Tax=Aureobasidium pullulans TaxID=5580 RepID=A0A4S8ZFL2_AURPU|nr:hypothetical protein D6D20_02810 [Aureobasidium pullulans]